MRVVVTDYIENDLEWERAIFEQQGIDFQAYQLKFAPLEALAEATAEADIVIVNMAPISAPLIAQMRNCKLLLRHGIGYDNVDVDALSEHGIRFANVPDYCVEEVAEQASALIMAMGRRVISSRAVLERSIEAGTWDFSSLGTIHRMYGRTLGIVGFGRIGSRLHDKLRNFGFNFLASDPYLSAARWEKAGLHHTPLEDLLAKSDFISLHVPVNDETHHLINARTLALMKPTAYLINTSRAEVVDQAALIEILRNERIAGAALDVFNPEPPHAHDPLITLTNVLLTPHIAWNSEEAGRQIREQLVDQVWRYQQGLDPLNWINRQALEVQDYVR